VKITPAHDFNDYEVGQRHGLPLINIFTPTRAQRQRAGAYRGLDRVRSAQAHRARGLEPRACWSARDHKLMVPRGDRSGASSSRC
jgi:valyl-tRNA synthetase